MYKIIIAGGTGFLGQSIIQHFQKRKDTQIFVLTRSKTKTNREINYVNWDAKTLAGWVNILEGSTAIINLVGKSVNCRYTNRNKKEIIESRINATLAIGKAINSLSNPPKVWINAGSAAIFGDGLDEIKDEYSFPGTGFSAEVCKQWEQAFNGIATPFTRKVFLRMGLVFQKNTGLLLPFVKLAKAGLGGKIGSGNQYISWIHEHDFLNLINVAVFDEGFKGIIHGTSPYPVTNGHFMKALRNTIKRYIGLPNPALLVKIGAFFIKTEAELVLTGRRVVSADLERKNFTFQYPRIEGALLNLLVNP
ncbi:MAG: hypothetical protein JWP81_4496 [Ferruginibacter sp.]|nr:hypothetical protein [Ferruginibacter sp.]